VAFCKSTLVQSRITSGALAELRHAYHEAALPAMRRCLAEAERGEGSEARVEAASAIQEGGTGGLYRRGGAGGAEGQRGAEGGDDASPVRGRGGPAWAALGDPFAQVQSLLAQWPLASSRRMRARMRVALLGLRCAGGRAALGRALALAAFRLVAWVALLWLLSWLAHGGLGGSMPLFSSAACARGPTSTCLSRPFAWLGRTRDHTAEAELRARLACLEDAYAALRARTSAFEACSRAVVALGGQQRPPPAECLKLPAAEPWLGAGEACHSAA